MSDKKQGKISFVAKTGGIKFEGDEDTWYNPQGKCKDYVKPDLKGCDVEIELSDKKDTDFIFLKKLGTSAPVQEESVNVSKNDYWENKEKRDIETQKKISRHGAYNTAIQLADLQLKCLQVTLSEKELTLLGHNAHENIKKLADQILAYVNGE